MDVSPNGYSQNKASMLSDCSNYSQQQYLQQPTPPTVWSSAAAASAELQQRISLQKLKPCCGYHHHRQCMGYEGVCMPVCQQQATQSRLYPTYMANQTYPLDQQMQGRSCHPHQHPGGPMSACHQQHPLVQSYPAPVQVAHSHPHYSMDKIMPSHAHVGSGAHHMRSYVVHSCQNPAPGYSHPSSHYRPQSVSNAGYYTQPVTTASAMPSTGTHLNYSHPQNHHCGNGMPMSSSNVSTIQQQQQQFLQQRAMSHQNSKSMTPSQAALYQNAYYQYTQYIQQQHGLLRNHQNGSAASSSNPQDRMYIMQQQQARMSSAIPDRHAMAGQPQPMHQFQNPMIPGQMPPLTCQCQCQSQAMNGAFIQQRQQLTPPSSEDSQSVSSAKSTDSQTSAIENTVETSRCCVQIKSKRLKSKSGDSDRVASISTEVLTSKVKTSSKTSTPKSPLMKLKSGSPDRLAKVKATKSLTRLRDLQPKLVTRRKKKLTSIHSERKGKSATKINSVGSCNPLREKITVLKKPVAVAEDSKPSIENAPYKLALMRPPPGFEHVPRPLNVLKPDIFEELTRGQLYHEGDTVPAFCLGTETQCSDSDADCSNASSLSPRSSPERQTLMANVKIILGEEGIGEAADDWETLNKDVKHTIDQWTHELRFMN